MKALAILLLILLVGCSSAQEYSPVTETNDAQISFWHDDEREVSCWIVGSVRGGISCIPDHMLKPQ